MYREPIFRIACQKPVSVFSRTILNLLHVRSSLRLSACNTLTLPQGLIRDCLQLRLIFVSLTYTVFDNLPKSLELQIIDIPDLGNLSCSMMAQKCTEVVLLLEVRYSIILPHDFSGVLEAYGGSRIAIYGNTSLANNRAYDYGGDRVSVTFEEFSARCP